MVSTSRDQLAQRSWASELPGITAKACRNEGRKGEKTEQAVAGTAAFFRPFPPKSGLIQSLQTKLRKKARRERPELRAECIEKVSLPCCAGRGDETGTLSEACVPKSFLHPASLFPRGSRLNLGQPVNQPLS